MFCPLCKAEYRTGFDVCSDCLIALVPTLSEANAVAVALLWKGTSQSKFNEIVDALRDANIPLLAKSGADPDAFYGEARNKSIWDYLPYIRNYKRMYDQMTWNISVLQSDYPRAQSMIGKVEAT